jgi:phosphomannomutase
MNKIKFGTDGWRAIIAKDFTVDNVQRVAKATADWAKQKDEHAKIVLGYDCRFGGFMFCEAAINVFCSNGIKVFFDKHFVSTPMVSLAARDLACEVGVIITASHNPPSYNGYKLKSKHGGPLIQKYVSEVEALIPESYPVETRSLEEWEQQGLLEFVDLETMYFTRVTNYFDLDVINDSEMLVAYDAMYGAGQNIFPRIMPHADFLHCEYNPLFNGQAPEPIAKNLKELENYLKEMKHVDIGFATDGDADRIGLYNGMGKFVDAHHIILILIHILHKYREESGKVVIAFSVSDKVKKLCEIYKLPVEVTKIGFKYICEIMQNENVLVGGEESGGIAVTGHIPERDGIWDGLIIIEHLIMHDQTLQELIDEVYELVGKFFYDRIDLYLKEEQKLQIIANCKSGMYKEFGGIPVTSIGDLDGFKFYLQDEETVLVRASGTEPVLRIYGEASSEERLKIVLDKVKDALLA